MQGNFSDRVRDVISFSRKEAIRLNHGYIGTEHLLLGIVCEGEGIAVKILRNLGCDPFKLKRALEDTVRDTGDALTVGNIPLTKQAEKVLKITYLEAKAYKSDVIGTEHLLLSLLRDDNNIAAQILQQGFSVSYDAVRAELDAIISGKGPVSGEKTRGIGGRREYAQAIVEDYSRTIAERGRRETRPHKATRMDEYCRDLTQKARLDLERRLRVSGLGRRKDLDLRSVVFGQRVSWRAIVFHRFLDALRGQYGHIGIGEINQDFITNGLYQLALMTLADRNQ